jgi:hypothetical protein
MSREEETRHSVRGNGYAGTPDLVPIGWKGASHDTNTSAGGTTLFVAAFHRLFASHAGGWLDARAESYRRLSPRVWGPLVTASEIGLWQHFLEPQSMSIGPFSSPLNYHVPSPTNT